MCSDQELFFLQPLLRGYSSGCIGSAEQPSLMEKGSRMTLHYSMTKGQCTWSCPPHTGTHVQYGTGKDSPRWTAYISTVGLLKLQSSTEKIEGNQEMGTTGSHYLSLSTALGNHGYPHWVTMVTWCSWRGLMLAEAYLLHSRWLQITASLVN